MNEIEFLLDRAQTCRTMARQANLSHDVERLEERAADFERQAAVLEARLSSRR